MKREKISKINVNAKGMQVIILGAGAIGSLFGAKLSKINDVTLIARKEHADKISKNGLAVAGLEKKVYKLKAAENIKEIKKDTLIILSTKVHDSQSAVRQIKKFLRKDTIILCLQNGLYSENIVKKIVGNKCTVLRAITNFGAIYLNPGSVNYTNYSYTAIEKNPRSMKIARNFSECGLNGYAAKDIRNEMWKKLVFNCIVNPLTAILRIENMHVTDDKLNPLKKLIADECKAVAEKDGIKLEIDFVRATNEEFRNSRNISSMQQDLLKGKKTEIDFLNGGVARLGKKYGIKCPVNDAIAAIIKEMERYNHNKKLLI